MESAVKLFKSYLSNVQKLIKPTVDDWLVQRNQFLLAASTVKTSSLQIFVDIPPTTTYKNYGRKKSKLSHILDRHRFLLS